MFLTTENSSKFKIQNGQRQIYSEQDRHGNIKQMTKPGFAPTIQVQLLTPIEVNGMIPKPLPVCSNTSNCYR